MTRVLVAAVLVVAACQTEAPPGQSYFDRVVEPVLAQSCAKGSGGCHRVDASDPFAFAAGNLDVTSFASLHKRPDVLRTFGVYPVPQLLLKAAAETKDLTISYNGQALPSLVPHAGGAILRVGDPAFLTLQTWLENGATETGVRPPAASVAGVGPCSTVVPDGFDEAALTATPQWTAHAGDFDGVQDVLTKETCNAQNCHGAPQSDFYLTCGSDAHQKAWNFRQVWGFVGDPVDTSELLRRPVAGGAEHGGGAHFASRDDHGYQTLATFAAAVGKMPPSTDPGVFFFADQVMPILLARGCAAEGCHSPAAMNDFKLRSGTQGFFSPIALEKNYELVKNDFMAFEVPDVRRGRVVAKNLLPQNGGIVHRGGPLLEYGDGAAVAVLQKWADLERGRMAPASPNPTGTPTKIVYVARAAGDQDLLRFTDDLGAGKLMVTDSAGATPRAISDGCGLDDVRTPDVRGDGTVVVFAGKKRGEPLHLWTVGIDGNGCKALTSGAAHDFDPSWSPDGSYVVFASTRRPGTTRRRGLPQSDIWSARVGSDGVSELRQMTFLSNSELGPRFIREGRVIMTTEKVDARDAQGGFYQLAGRRINWDLTDYHPLLGQRKQSSADPAAAVSAQSPLSIGYSQVTELREALDGDYLLIGSEPGAPAAAGDLVEFNRSVGPFENGRADAGYLRAAKITKGKFRSPSQLPDGRVLVSQASGGNGFDLVTIDAAGTVQPLVACGGAACVEATPALAHPARPFYQNRRQLVFGGDAAGDRAHAVVHFPDAPMVGTLLGANLRRGRDVTAFRAADHLAVLDADGHELGSAPLAADGSVKIRAPAATPLYLALTKGGAPLFQMTEEHQFGPGEDISIGVPEAHFDHVCAGCHGSVSGKETDIGVSADALTGASVSVSRGADPVAVGN
jgi:hypothetical protein